MCVVFLVLQPGLWKEGGVSRSLAEVVLDAVNEVDSTSRAEMLEDIVVVGGSAHLDGLGDRLEEDLKVQYSTCTREVTPSVFGFVVVVVVVVGAFRASVLAALLHLLLLAEYIDDRIRADGDVV